MESVGISPVRAVEVIRDGHRISPILTPAAVSSRRVEWNGIALEAFHDVPASNIPEHEHPTHFLICSRPAESGRNGPWTAAPERQITVRALFTFSPQGAAISRPGRGQTVESFL
jgi:hypothetical protein